MEAIQTLGRTYSMEILGAADEPKSAVQLSDSLDIPIATCYRRVEELVSAGLLKKCQESGDDSTRATFYQRTTDAVGIQFGPMPSIFTWAHLNASVAGVSALGVTAENDNLDQPSSEHTDPHSPDATETDD